MNLEELKIRASTCTACPLSRGRTQVVFGEGNLDAQLMIVGEGPGEDEDKSGRPFVGRAGQLLDKILESAGIVRSDIYITNIVKCRPPGNRNPTPEEEKTCSPKWLLPQIDLIRPQIIAPLGSVAAQFFLGKEVPITRLRGHWSEWNGIKIFPMFHPAYLLRNPVRTPEGPKALTWNDIRELKAALDRLEPKPEDAQASHPATQDSLF